MSNHLSNLLQAWKQDKDKTDWVLGTVYKTEGSAYRKAGAFSLINGLGQQYGLLSGGCLEADILRQARKVMQSGRVEMLEYDATDEDDLSFQLGIGCGGKVYVMLQPVTSDNDLDLSAMSTALETRERGCYHQRIGASEAFYEPGGRPELTISSLEQREGGEWLTTPIIPAPHLLVVGGGIDARPVISLAAEMGWETSLVDPRPANARAEYFPAAGTIFRQLDESLSQYLVERRVDAVVIMSHSLEIDAKGLRCCQDAPLSYVALLGPRHRYAQVVERAGLQELNLRCPVSAPAGLDIGGQLPESIALSILAECHAVLNQRAAINAIPDATS